jgi:oxygen-independent coproporphyrinogen-3 oxidase
MNTKPGACYVHVPFCHKICYYCDFCHVVYRRELVHAWLEALAAELRAYPPGELKTLYIGGGTPSCLSLEETSSLLSLFAPSLPKAEEVTIEINPESLTREKAQLYADLGINRASLGFEAAQPDMLRKLNRSAGVKETAAAVRMLQEAGISNISLDLLYSLPGQTMAMLQESVEAALRMHPVHLSLYSLTIEPDTVFGKKGVKSCEEDLEADMYEWICRRLQEAGYMQYEISNFCLPGFASQHNLCYWHYDDFSGYGCGASGKEGEGRYDHTRSLRVYLKNPLAREWIPLSREDRMFEMIMMGMRLKQGMDKQLFQARFGLFPDQQYPRTMARLFEQGLIEDDARWLKASPRGFAILNTVLEEFMDEDEDRKQD